MFVSKEDWVDGEVDGPRRSKNEMRESEQNMLREILKKLIKVILN